MDDNISAAMQRDINTIAQANHQFREEMHEWKQHYEARHQEFCEGIVKWQEMLSANMRAALESLAEEKGQTYQRATIAAMLMPHVQMDVEKATLLAQEILVKAFQ